MLDNGYNCNIIEEYEILGKKYLISSMGEVIYNNKIISERPYAPKVPFDKSIPKVITMCINVSPVCNLRCKYCFRTCDGPEFSFEEIKRYIDCVTKVYPSAERYIIDLSGSGEPLLRMPLLLKIADYCHELSNRHVREFLPTLACNGTLLTKEVVEQLQKAGILFGVSLDGDKQMHDRNRVFANGQGTFDLVESNLKNNIKNNSMIGISLTYSTPELLRAYKAVCSLAPTISMKPVRYTKENEFDADEMCKSYNELIEYVLGETLKGDLSHLARLLRGQDLFGRFLKRVSAHEIYFNRCDAGFGRFALAYDKKIYCCPAAFGIKECEIGDLVNGINEEKMKQMWELVRNDECNHCFARDVCGGECILVSYNKFKRLDKLDPTMCKLKKHIYLLALHVCQTLKEEKPEYLDWLIDQTKMINGFFKPDEELIEAVKLSNGKYTFTELKSFKDFDKEKFYKIYNELKSKNK